MAPIALVIILGFAAVFGYAILQPAADAARDKPGKWRFYISDFFTLSFLLAIPLVYVTSVHRRLAEEGTLLHVVIVLLLGVFAYIWWRGTIVLSRIGIQHTGRRILFLGVLVPTAFIGAAVGVPILVACAFSLEHLSPMAITCWFVGVVAAPVLAMVCRMGVCWVVADREYRVGTRSDDHFG